MAGKHTNKWLEKTWRWIIEWIERKKLWKTAEKARKKCWTKQVTLLHFFNRFAQGKEMTFSMVTIAPVFQGWLTIALRAIVAGAGDRELFWTFEYIYMVCLEACRKGYCTGPSLWPKRKPFCHEWVLHPHRSVGAKQHSFWKLRFCTFILFSPISKTPTLCRDFQGVVNSIPSPRHIYILFPNIKYFNFLFSTLR